MRIVFVGGGTGGHFYPLLAVAEEIRNNPAGADAHLYYMGPDVFDKEGLNEFNIAHVPCPAGKTRRYFSIQNFTDFFRNIAGIFVAIFKLFSIYPDVIFSKGSYTSIPVLIAAKILFIPVVIHESDSVPSRASKLGKGIEQYIAISYPKASQYFPEKKTALTGIPIRPAAVKRYDKTEVKSYLDIPSDKPLIYITGGSQGALRVNNEIIEALPTLLQQYRIYHQVGADNVSLVEERLRTVLPDETSREGYYMRDHLPKDQVAMILSAADLVITRAGSTSLFEIALHETPAIVIPIPESISHDQRSNAYAYAGTGAAVVIEEENLSENILSKEISGILENPAQYQNMVAATQTMQYPEAAKKISDILLKIGTDHGS